MPCLRCFVFGMDKFCLSMLVGLLGYNVYWRSSWVFQMFLRHWFDNVVKVTHFLQSVCSGAFDKSPVWIATGFKCSPDMRLFLLLPLSLSGHGLSPMVKGSDDPQLLLQWEMRVKQQIYVCRFSVCNVEASVFSNVYYKVQEGQTAPSDIVWTLCYCPQHLYVLWGPPLPLFWFWPRCPHTWTSG